MRVFALLSSVTVIAGCSLPMGNFEIDPTGSSTSFSVPNAVSGSCGATGLQNLLDQPESALNNVTLPANTRIIRPGTAYTKDANRSRLNIGIAADGTIVHVACG